MEQQPGSALAVCDTSWKHRHETLIHIKKQLNLGKCLGEIDFSTYDMSAADNMDLATQTILCFTKLMKLSLARCNLNGKCMQTMNKVFSEKKNFPNVSHLDLSHNPKIGSDQDALKLICETVTVLGTKVLALRECSLYEKETSYFARSMVQQFSDERKSGETCMLDEIDLSRDPIEREKKYDIHQNLIIDRYEGGKSEVLLGALGKNVMGRYASPVEMVKSVIPLVKNCVRIENWYLTENDQQNLLEYMDSQSSSMVQIITGRNGSNCFYKAMRAKDTGRTNEMHLQDCILKVPDCKTPIKPTLALSETDMNLKSEDYLILSPIISCGPSGAKFEQPAEIKVDTWLRYNEDIDASMVVILWRGNNQSEWKELENPNVKLSVAEGCRNGQLSVAFQTNHFSDFMVSIIKAIKSHLRKIKEWWFRVVLSTEIYVFRDKVVPVFCINQKSALDHCYRHLEAGGAEPLMPLDKIIDVPLNCKITSSLVVDDTENLTFTFNPRANTHEKWWFKEFNVLNISNSVLFSVFYEKDDGSYEEVFSDKLSMSRPSRQVSINSTHLEIVNSRIENLLVHQQPVEDQA